MNTFGLGKGVNRFWLGVPYALLIDAWKEIVRFTVYIKQSIGFDVER
jgi:hypothetical protein